MEDSLLLRSTSYWSTNTAADRCHAMTMISSIVVVLSTCKCQICLAIVERRRRRALFSATGAVSSKYLPNVPHISNHLGRRCSNKASPVTTTPPFALYANGT
jgi:hypothetical protein